MARTVAPDPPPALGGLFVQSVDEASDLWSAGLRPGDEILAIDGLRPRDLIDLQLDLPGASAVTLRRGAAAPFTVPFPRGVVDATALALQDPVPGGIRECNNHCEFCFIRGMPKGLRRSLYVFDDDYRYSFLWGNFLTLTNLDEADWARIGYQRLSPLNVSVHATDPAVRRMLLNNRHAEPVLPRLERLGRLGVRVNAQVVLCAGLNDGAVLERTIHDLSALFPAVQSLSIVPVGLTRFSRVKHVRRPSQEEAGAALELCERWQRDLLPRLGLRFVYPSDELCLLAGRDDLPPAEAYDGFPVLTNGVGMVRSMVDSWDRSLARRRRSPRRRGVVWLTGRLAAPALERMADRWERYAGWRPDVRIVENRFFGEQVSVSGLLTGADLSAALRELPAGIEDVVLPRGAFGFDGARTLDGVPAAAVGEIHPGRVYLASTPEELLDVMFET